MSTVPMLKPHAAMNGTELWTYIEAKRIVSGILAINCVEQDPAEWLLPTLPIRLVP
jgi:hypothetical protein